MNWMGTSKLTLQKPRKRTTSADESMLSEAKGLMCVRKILIF